MIQLELIVELRFFLLMMASLHNSRDSNFIKPMN